MTQLRSIGSILVAVGLALAAAACGGGGGDQPGSDAGTAADAAAPVTPTFKVHYHRPLGDYADWKVATTAGAMEASASAGTPDGFGAVYTLTVTSGAPSLAFSLKKGDTSDGAGALTVDVSGRTREVWVISGWPEAITRALPALPGANQVAFYYLRPDGAYSGWGLHLWGDQVTNTAWTMPASQRGVDPGFGAGFVVDLKPGAAPANCPPGNICFIVHMGDTKDPGPDITKYDPKTYGNIIFLLSGSADISSSPRKVGDVGIAGVGAHLVDAATIAWCTKRDSGGVCVGDATLTKAELRVSPTVEIAAADGAITGGTVIPLTHKEALSAEQLALAPYLKGASVWTIGESDRAKLPEAVKGQMIAVARKEDGKLGLATQVNTSLYLDEAFATTAPLGPRFAGGVPTIAVWAPTALSMKLHVYDGDKEEITGSPFTMTRGEKGVWEQVGQAAWKGKFYRFQLSVYHPLTGKIEDLTTTDPYAVNLSTNGTYAQLVDLDDPTLAPGGWAAPVNLPLEAPEDIVIYESHIRDFSVADATTPAERRGKYLGFETPPATTPSDGLKHLAALAQAGMTHIHLLPAFDIATIDEDPANRVELDDTFARLCQKNSAVPASLCGQFPTQTIRQALGTFQADSETQQQIAGYLRGYDGFNWGYDPVHYGAPEGSYASKAEGTARIVEFRRMVQALHDLGLRVVMDVVYNHTNSSGLEARSVLDKLVPGYYHRVDPESGFVYTSSCCANTASEHKMMGRLIVDLSIRWARDYKIDGFRFDLMGLHMKTDIIAVQSALAALKPGPDGVDGSKLYVYGEGWDMGELQNGQRGVNATQANMAGTGIGTFNDRLRDGARGGGPFDNGNAVRAGQGFASGLYTNPNELSAASDDNKTKLAVNADYIKVGMAGSLADFRLVASHGQPVQANQIGYGNARVGYTQDPQESINYTSAHDGLGLWDMVQLKLPLSTPTADRVRSVELALDVILVGQGIPFVHMGDDMLRSKSADKNSYDSGDWFNLIDWSGQLTAWRMGLPPAGDNTATWPVIKKIYGEATTWPRPSDIAASSAHVQEMLRIRRSSPLFRLRTKADVLKRVDFLNTGPSQVPGVIVMTLADGTCAGADLDAGRDGLIVVVNGDKQVRTMTVPGAAGAVLHPIQQASADDIVKGASVSGTELTVPPRTTAVFEVAQSQDRTGGPPCNAH